MTLFLNKVTFWNTGRRSDFNICISGWRHDLIQNGSCRVKTDLRGGCDTWQGQYVWVQSGGQLAWTQSSEEGTLSGCCQWLRGDAMMLVYKCQEYFKFDSSTASRRNSSSWIEEMPLEWHPKEPQADREAPGRSKLLFLSYPSSLWLVTPVDRAQHGVRWKSRHVVSEPLPQHHRAEDRRGRAQ